MEAEQSVPTRLLRSLRCSDCSSTELAYVDGVQSLECQTCGTRYNAPQGIPSMVAGGGVEDQDWNSWNSEEVDRTAGSYYKRATGELPEKEASKSLARLLERRDLYEPGTTLLDVGCAAGHYLKSLRRLLDPDILYTGLDIGMEYLLWGREAYGIDDTCTFVHSDALAMPFPDDSFDIVYANLYHFFPRIDEALAEALRVANERVLWRTPIGEITYAAKLYHNDDFEDLGVVDLHDNQVEHTLYMMYSENYLRGLIDHMGWELEFIEKDDDFEEFDNNEHDEFEGVPATKVVDGRQINGNLVVDWHYLSIRK